MSTLEGLMSACFQARIGTPDGELPTRFDVPPQTGVDPETQAIAMVRSWAESWAAHHGRPVTWELSRMLYAGSPPEPVAEGTAAPDNPGSPAAQCAAGGQHTWAYNADAGLWVCGKCRQRSKRAL
ncbi:MAG: hypothetical protein GEV11_16575 [Streptosporangiales bacterium]|nr:hypothetical protein [Streptosporangiales bacterium]